MRAYHWGSSVFLADLDEEVFHRNQNEQYNQAKSKLYNEVIGDRALLSVCAKHTSPIERAGKKIKEKFMEMNQPCIPTGFQGLDKQLAGGIQARSVTQILGPERGGKTTFIHHFMRHFLETNLSSTVLYISPQDDSAVLLKRVAAIHKAQFKGSP